MYIYLRVTKTYGGVKLQLHDAVPTWELDSHIRVSGHLHIPVALHESP
jgi:hypothetical protein